MVIIIISTSTVTSQCVLMTSPDRYVLLGNHRDAWMFGAVDPTSGTAVMVELSRVFAQLVSEGTALSSPTLQLYLLLSWKPDVGGVLLCIVGWRPRRTIVFCSWGAEEFGLTGSYEYVEVTICANILRYVTI